MKDFTITQILYYLFENTEAVKIAIIVITLLEIIGAILIFIGIMNIEMHNKNLDNGQDSLIKKVETLEYQCANINNNLQAILAELQEINNKTPYQENNEFNKYVP